MRTGAQPPIGSTWHLGSVSEPRPPVGCSPRVRPFPPRPPPEVAFLCSIASSVLRPHPTSHPRTCSAYGFCLPEPARQKFYEARHVKSGFISLPVDPSASEEERFIAANICRQLGESGLIDWKGSLGPGIDGAGRITSRGIDVIEGNAPPPIAITIESRQISVHGSSNVQIGAGNAQGITIRADKVIAAINDSQATVEEKEKARSAVQSILSSPLLTKIFGWVTGSPD